MDIFDEEMLNYWRCLNKCSVRYIMVGGVATNFNGYNRTTDDIDVWLEDTPANRDNYRKAFHQYSGIDYAMINTMQIIPGWTNFNPLFRTGEYSFGCTGFRSDSYFFFLTGR